MSEMCEYDQQELGTGQSRDWGFRHAGAAIAIDTTPRFVGTQVGLEFEREV